MKEITILEWIELSLPKFSYTVLLSAFIYNTGFSFFFTEKENVKQRLAQNHGKMRRLHFLCLPVNFPNHSLPPPSVPHMKFWLTLYFLMYFLSLTISWEYISWVLKHIIKSANIYFVFCNEHTLYQNKVDEYNS